jgi:hypothetical protein
MHFARRHTVNSSLGLSDPLENGNGPLLHPCGKFAGGDQRPDFGEVPAVIVVMMLVMMVPMLVFMPMPVIVVMVMGMFVRVVMIVIVFDVHIELHAVDPGLLPAGNVEVITVEPEFLQFLLELADLDAQVDQRAEEHVAADAAEQVEIKRFHIFNRRERKERREKIFVLFAFFAVNYFPAKALI